MMIVVIFVGVIVSHIIIIIIISVRDECCASLQSRPRTPPRCC